MAFKNERRCTNCGEFYHADAMKGNKCYSCAEDSSTEYNEYFSDDEVEYEGNE